MDPRIPTLKITTPPTLNSDEDTAPPQSESLENSVLRDSLDTLNSHLNNTQGPEEDEDDLSLNNDLASVSISRDYNNSLGPSPRKSFDSSSIFTSSFRQSFEDNGGLPLLGFNNVSMQSYSPLGPNSIYELVADADAKQRRRNSLKANPNPKGATLNILKPTVNDIPPVSIPKIDKADKTVLKEYLNQVDGECEKFNSNKKLTTSSLNKMAKSPSKGILGTSDTVEDLDTIPSIYFSNNFNLDDPRIFEQVIEGHKLHSLNDVLQEKLSYYLDTIEVHLVNEISKSSNSFFEALNDLSDINSKNTKTMELITKLSSDLSDLKKGKIQTNLEKVKLQKKKENVSKIEQILIQLSKIRNELTLAEGKFYNSEYESCLDKLDDIESLIKGKSSLTWPYPLSNLTLLPALQPIHKSISQLKLQTGESYTKLFIDYLMNDLRSHYEDLNHGEVFERIISEPDSQKSEVSQEFKDGLLEYLKGLVRCESIPDSLIQYQNQVLNEMKNIVRVYLPNEDNIEQIKINSGSTPSVTSTSKGNGVPSLGQLIKSLTPKEFEYVLVQIITTCTEGFKRLKVHQKLLLELTLNSIPNVSNDLVSALDINGAINKSIEIVQLRLGKVIKVRIDLNSMLRYDYFLRLFFINSSFINGCESISGLTFKELPQVLNEQVKGFNANTFNNYKGKVFHMIEKEEWKPAIVEVNVQEMTTRITNNDPLDPDAKWKSYLLEYIKSTDTPSEMPTPSATKESATENEEEEEQQPQPKSHKRSLVVGDKMFVASNVLLVLIDIVHELLILKTYLPHLSPTYEHFTLDLVRTFVSRTTQAISKEGKLNTEINLSVVGESLDCIVEILQYVRIVYDDVRMGEEYERTTSVIRGLKTKIDNSSMMRMG